MRNRRAFTYAELMIAMAIVALLAVIAIPNFTEAHYRAAVARSRAELTALKLAIDAYHIDQRAYPVNRTPGAPAPADLTVLTTPVAYLSSLPMDVFTTSDARSRRLPRVEPAPYRYCNGLQFDPEGGLKPLGETTAILRGYVIGLVWGYGPGTAEPRATGLSDSVRIYQHGEIVFTIYDPSNGTTSPGDLALPVP